MFLLPNILSAISCQSVGHLLGITLGQNALMGHIVLLSLMIVYGGALTRDDDLSLLTKYMSMLNPTKQNTIHVITYLYGFDMCPSGQTSAIMSYMEWTDKSYYQSLYLMIFQSMLFTFLAYIGLKIRKNLN